MVQSGPIARSGPGAAHLPTPSDGLGSFRCGSVHVDARYVAQSERVLVLRERARAAVNPHRLVALAWAMVGHASALQGGAATSRPSIPHAGGWPLVLLVRA